ncbi:MAG: hypothetical protein IH851_06400 [Armatimonadetes bacterium]|nr:hypothetical protein [Armatimonadota bacterium]
MKRFLVIGALGAALTMSTTPGLAQQEFEFESRSRFSFRAGGYFPFETALSDLEDVWFALGADLEVPLTLVPNATTVFSVDWFSFNGGSGMNAFPVLINQRWYSGPWGQRTYVQVGAGGAFLDFGTSEFVVAARVGFGFEFNDLLFFEASFYWTDDHTGGGAATGAAGFIGARF